MWLYDVGQAIDLTVATRTQVLAANRGGLRRGERESERRLFGAGRRERMRGKRENERGFN